MKFATNLYFKKKINKGITRRKEKKKVKKTKKRRKKKQFVEKNITTPTLTS